MATDSSQRDPLESLITAEATTQTFSPTSQDLADPEQALRNLEARKEIEHLQLTQIADLIPLLKEMIFEEFREFKGLLTELHSLLQEQRMLNDLQASVAKREVLWMKAVQGQFVMKEYPLKDGEKTLEAEAQGPTASRS